MKIQHIGSAFCFAFYHNSPLLLKKLFYVPTITMNLLSVKVC